MPIVFLVFFVFFVSLPLSRSHSVSKFSLTFSVHVFFANLTMYSQCNKHFLQSFPYFMPNILFYVVYLNYSFLFPSLHARKHSITITISVPTCFSHLSRFLTFSLWLCFFLYITISIPTRISSFSVPLNPILSLSISSRLWSLSAIKRNLC